jgi:CubicO group peptidase (beta-lactamase class C family)
MVGAPPLSGDVDGGFEPVREAFADLLRSGEETGAALAVHHEGRRVVDLVGGWADAARTRPWRHDTLVHTYSVSKPFAALAALVCVADGRLELDAPIARTWPAYAEAGKGATTLRHALAHLAAQPAFPDGLGVEALYDVRGLEDALAGAAPEWEPGTAPAEHALTYGHLLSGVVRSATGRSLGEVFRDEVAGPLGLDAHFGVPDAELGRVADLEHSAPDWPETAAGAPGTLGHRCHTRPPGTRDLAVLNSRAWRTTEFAAIGLHSQAGSVAGFYGALLDEHGPVARLLGPTLHRELLTPVVTGHDLMLDREVTWTLGLQLDDHGYGLGGLGGCDAYVDTRHGFGYAYLTRRLADHRRSEQVLAALEQVLG